MIGSRVNHFAWTVSNMSAPSTTPGTSVVPGATNAEGSFTEVLSDLANDAYGILIWISGGATSAQAKNHLLDIGVDPAGGTSYVSVISNIPCGQSTVATAGGIYFYFPLFIPAGGAVAVRIQGNNGTAGTVRIGVKVYGRPTHPEAIRVGRYSETIGTVGTVNAIGSSGTGFTPGNNGAEGTWVSLGTTTRAMWWWQLGVQLSNGTTAVLAYKVDLAYGDATNKHMILEDVDFEVQGAAEQNSLPLQHDGYCEVPAGSELWVRGSCSGTTAVGFNALAVGIGG